MLAAELNSGPGFSAVLGGVGTNLEVPGFAFWTLNAFLRDDNFNAPTYQVTTAWSLPFQVAGIGFAFDGFVDLYGSDATKWNVMTQPQLLVDVGAAAGMRERRLQVGSELWVHRTADNTTLAPQVIAKFTY
jgi:nucleoside-specific outer membrane channel protein Tsx